jgi:hypothetical protein
VRARHFLVLAAAALFVAFGPPERTTPTTWARVVGIGDYIHFGDEMGGDLPGAANDARAMADLLVNRFGFQPDNVKLILDHAATRDRLAAELGGWLPSVVRPGDHVTFYFAGHGSQTWNLDGTEEDGLDETICPADVMRGNTERDIRDKELAVWLSQINTDNIVVIWDKCHARGSTRAVTPFARPRNLARNVESDVGKPEEAEKAAAMARAQAELYADGLPEQPGILEIAASQSDEVALDIAWPNRTGGSGHTWGGAFTTPFVQNLWQAGPDATYGEVFGKTTNDMRRNRFRQEPGIDDKPLRDRPLFWGSQPEQRLAAPPAAPAAPVRGVARILEIPEHTVAVLAGGSSANMTRGSVYGAGEDILEITALDPDRAVTRIATRETRGIGVARGDEMRVGSNARLLAYRYPEPMLRVMVDPAVPPELSARLRASLMSVPTLMLVEDPTSFAHLLIQPRNRHYVVFNVEGFPRDSVAIPGDPVGAVPGLAEILKREFGQFHLAELENPANPFEMRFEFGNRRQDFVLGEEVSFRVFSERDGYLTIVDLSADGKVTVIFPNQYVSHNRVQGGSTTTIPTPEMNLVFPAVEPVGRGIVRAFVTERPMIIPFAQGGGFAVAVPLAARVVSSILSGGSYRPPRTGLTL